jgi:hypothetical protein
MFCGRGFFRAAGARLRGRLLPAGWHVVARHAANFSSSAACAFSTRTTARCVAILSWRRKLFPPALALSLGAVQRDAFQRDQALSTQDAQHLCEQIVECGLVVGAEA